MYERSAVVLEKYFSNIFGFGDKINLKTNYKNFKDLIEEFQKYQVISEKEEKIINEFDDSANQIRKIQQEQKRLYKSNIKFEEERNQLFDNLDESPDIIEKKLQKIENVITDNNNRLIELKEEFTNCLNDFNSKQEERNSVSKEKRVEEKNYMQLIQKTANEINEINKENIKNIKMFMNSENNSSEELVEIMLSNGKDERIKFNEEVMQKAAIARNEIAKREAECYANAYDKTRKLINDINSDDVNVEKYQKILRDISVKFSFLKAEKIYIVDFLDNERMTAINGTKMHKNLMAEACENFELDITQINNLYQLVLREIAGKSTKKAYNELYNKEYLKNIEEKEKNFEKEINGLKIKAGTIINSNYWRIDGIKNIYETFNQEITSKFGKDLSEYQLEDIEEQEDDYEEMLTYKSKEIDNEITEYIDDYEDEEDEYKDNFDDSDIEDDEYEKKSGDDTENDDEEDYEDYDEYEDDLDEEDDYDDYDEYEDDLEDSDDYANDDDEEDYEDYDEYEDDLDGEDDYDEEDDDDYDNDDDEYDDEEDDDDYDNDYDEYDDEEEDDDYEGNIEEKKTTNNHHKNSNSKENSRKEIKEDKKSKGIFNKFFKDKK
ncbi:unknown [Clostridium sp. CAG:575]|nr:unknown [Clostridium sp. CAG:575]